MYNTSMKLVLASAGIETKGVVEVAAELVGKSPSEISVAFILEAHAVKDSDKRWQINELHKTAQIFGGMIRIVNLLALDTDEIERRLLASDIVFCLGGNTGYLKTVFDKSGLSEILPRILDKCVWIGNSAGSIILSKRSPYREAVAHEKKETFGVTEYLGLVDCHIIPHVGADNDPKHLLETCIEESRRQTAPVYALSDESALVIDGDKQYLLGKNCHKIVNGKILEEQ